MIDLASGPSAISVSATAVGALSGALFAVKRRFGLSGVFCLAFSTGVSGSIMRDVLLQSGPSVILTDVEFLLAVQICATTGFSSRQPSDGFILCWSSSMRFPLGSLRFWAQPKASMPGSVRWERF
jgi:Glycine transporter